MKVLILCEESQVVTTAFRERGHDAYSCDLQPCSGGHPEWHIQGDALQFLEDDWYWYWDLLIVHPPCNYISNMSNCRIREPGRKELRRKGMEFFMKFTGARTIRVCIENPRGLPEREYRRADQIIQPHQFGHAVSKATCLWLKNLPPLAPTDIVEPVRKYDGKRWRTWVDAGAKAHTSKCRSKTFPGIAKAMAEQWGLY